MCFFVFISFLLKYILIFYLDYCKYTYNKKVSIFCFIQFFFYPFTFSYLFNTTTCMVSEIFDNTENMHKALKGLKEATQ